MRSFLNHISSRVNINPVRVALYKENVKCHCYFCWSFILILDFLTIITEQLISHGTNKSLLTMF